MLGGESERSTVELAVGDVTPPEPPAGLVADVVLADVTLSWTASVSLDVLLYRVLRDAQPVAETTFVDVLVPDGSYDYDYEVVAVDAAENVSAPSNTAQATVAVDAPDPPVLSLAVVPAGEASSPSKELTVYS